jgi:CcmD family protein
MDNANFTFLVYGLVAAWLILFAYVAALAARERRLKREIESLKHMLGEQERR